MIDLAQLSIAVPLAVLCVLVTGFSSGTEVALFSLRRVEREQLAHTLLDGALRPFVAADAPGGFAAALPLLEQLCRDFADTDVVLAAYALLDGGRGELALAPP